MHFIKQPLIVRGRQKTEKTVKKRQKTLLSSSLAIPVTVSPSLARFSILRRRMTGLMAIVI